MEKDFRILWTVIVLQEGRPLPGPETGLLSNTRKWIVWGDTCADKAWDFIGRGHLGGEQEGKGTQENCSVTWLAVSGFLVMGLVSGLSLANNSDSESFLVVHTLFNQHGCQREGFWEVVWHVVSPFGLSRMLLVGGGLLVTCSLPVLPLTIVRNTWRKLMEMRIISVRFVYADFMTITCDMLSPLLATREWKGYIFPEGNVSPAF